MIKTLTLTAVGSALILTGCTDPYSGRPDNTGTGALTGGAIGAGAGAAIGSASGHAGEGALIGAAVGLLSGGLIGHSIDQQQQAELKAQAPATYVKVEQNQPLSVADVKALAKSGISEDIIISQIRASRSVYRLSTADIIDMRDSGVSNKVIDYMINTGMGAGEPSAQAAPGAEVVVQDTPPPPIQETVVMSPGPGYVWVAGSWGWGGGRWVWTGGHWILPPPGHVVWVDGVWVRHPHGWYYRRGYWR